MEVHGLEVQFLIKVGVLVLKEVDGKLLAAVAGCSSSGRNENPSSWAASGTRAVMLNRSSVVGNRSTISTSADVDCPCEAASQGT